MLFLVFSWTFCFKRFLRAFACKCRTERIICSEFEKKKMFFVALIRAVLLICAKDNIFAIYIKSGRCPYLTKMCNTFHKSRPSAKKKKLAPEELERHPVPSSKVFWFCCTIHVTLQCKHLNWKSYLFLWLIHSACMIWDQAFVLQSNKWYLEIFYHFFAKMDWMKSLDCWWVKRICMALVFCCEERFGFCFLSKFWWL